MSDSKPKASMSAESTGDVGAVPTEAQQARIRASWDIKNMRRRVNRLRSQAFPHHTCASSRHLHMMAEALASGRPYPMLQEEPQHCAQSMLAVLECLWKARMDAEHAARIEKSDAKD